jgi:hypothetical protein
MSGRDTFHCVPGFDRNNWDAVERVPTRGGALGTARPTTIFGARNIAGFAGDARRFTKHTIKESN